MDLSKEKEVTENDKVYVRRCFEGLPKTVVRISVPHERLTHTRRSRAVELENTGACVLGNRGGKEPSGKTRKRTETDPAIDTQRLKIEVT